MNERMLVASSFLVFVAMFSPIVFSPSSSPLQLPPDGPIGTLFSTHFLLMGLFGVLAIISNFLVIRSIRGPDVSPVVGRKNEFLQMSYAGVREPLAKIKGFIELAIAYNSDRRSAEVLSALKHSFSSVEELDSYVVSMQCLSAYQRGALDKNNSWVDVCTFFSNLDKRFSVKCKSKPSVAWNCFSSDQVNGKVFIDKELVSLIISSAIDNAIKCTNRGFVYVSYKFESGRLLVEVHDSGVGTPDTASDSELGFAAMQRFVSTLGGSINIDSKTNFGTKISISIPAEFIPEEGGDEEIVVTNDMKVPCDCNELAAIGLKVLVISNDGNYIERLKDMLSPEIMRRQDLKVTYCSDSSEAILLVEEVSFNLIVIDNDLPCMNASRFLQFLHTGENECRAAMKVVIAENTSKLNAVGHEVLQLADKVAVKSDTLLDIKSVIRLVSLKCVG